MIDKLEKKIGKYAVKNLIYYILGGYVIGYILYFMYAKGASDIYAYITLSPEMVMHGQVWRLFTWVLTIPQSLSIWIIFMFLFYFFIGRSLEQTLGAFRYNLYMFSGWLFTTLGAMVIYWITKGATGVGISMSVSTYYLNMASFLAFAVLFPDVKVYFFGILPIKIKILAWIDAGLMLLEVAQYGMALILVLLKDTSIMEQVLSNSSMVDTYATILEYYSVEVCVTGIFSILISVLNFLIFFIMNRKKRSDANRRREEFAKRAAAGRAQYAAGGAYASAQQQKQAEPKKSYRPEQGAGLVHKCDVCGRTSLTNPELQFRYCSKCEGNHEYCQDHLFTHVHIK